ncbi:replication protein A 70 kDa DNA-binding subunit C-like protein [Tanacetum coccineum]
MSTKPASTSLSTKIADMAAPPQSNPTLFLDELKVDGTSSIIKMVGRVWDGNMIHCTAKATIAHNFLRLKGGIFLIKNFAVLPNKDEFWVFRHDMFMLEFDGSTTIRKVFANSVGYVRYTFQLVDFDDIELTNNMYMIDVSDYVANVERTTYTKSGRLCDDCYIMYRGRSLKVTLWGGVGDSLIEKKTTHVGMCAIMLTSMTAKTYNNKLYLSSTSSTVIYDNHDISSLQELRSVTSLVEPNKGMMMVDSSQPREGRRKSGWNYPSYGGEKCRKSISRKAGKFLCETCNRTVDYPVLRLEVIVADDTTHTIAVIFNEIATELLNYSADSLIEADDESAEDDSGLPTAIRNLIGTTHVMELKSHTYYEYGSYESFTCWKINPADLVDDGASSSNQLITVNDLVPSFKRLTRDTSVYTPSKPNKEKSKKRSKLEDSDTDEVLCSAKDPHEINDDGPVDKKKRKMHIDEDSHSVCIVSGLWSEKMPKFHQLIFTIKDEEDGRGAYSRK